MRGFWATATASRLIEAGKKLYLSQSALSHQLRDLNVCLPDLIEARAMVTDAVQEAHNTRRDDRQCQPY